jgi:hypothetical protein
MEENRGIAMKNAPCTENYSEVGVGIVEFLKAARSVSVRGVKCPDAVTLLT